MSDYVNRKVAPSIHPLVGMRLPGVKRMELPNGIKVVCLDHGQQPVSRIMVVWNAGMADAGAPEVLRLLRTTLPEGTESYSGEELSELFEFNGAWIKVEAGMHSTSITVHALNKSLPTIMPAVIEMIKAPVFPQDAFVRIREKEAAACDLRLRKVEQKAANLSRSQLYGSDHPLAHVETGTSIRAVERDAVTGLYDSLLASVPPTVYIAGCVDDALLSELCGVFGRLEFRSGGSPLSQTIVPVKVHENGIKGVMTDENSMQTAIKLVIPTIGRDHADYEALRVTVFALGGYFGSRLMSNIREEKGYTYGINAALASLKEGAHTGVSCQCDNRYAAAVLDEIEHEIHRLAIEPMGEEELEIVKSSIMSGLTSMLDSPFSIMDYHFILDTYGMDDSYYEHQLNTLRSITSEKLMDCARRYLLDAPRLIALAGNPQ